MNPPAVAVYDGLGERRQTTSAGNQRLDLVIVREELGSAPGFEQALHARRDEVARFQHPSYARIRGVGRPAKGQSRLIVAADHVAGVRLSEVLAVAERRLLPLEFDAALGLLRQLVRAVAALHESVPQASHGALAPERLVVTADARLVVVDHVFGAALEQLRYSHERYWKELRVALPLTGGAPRFDRRADVTQIGAVALALIMGRPLGDDEYPSRVADIIEGVGAVSPRGVEPLPAGVRSWLSRALQLDARRSFNTAIEADTELEETTGAGERPSQDALVAFLARYHAATGIEAESEQVEDAARFSAPGEQPTLTASQSAISIAERATEEVVEVPRSLAPHEEPTLRGSQAAVRITEPATEEVADGPRSLAAREQPALTASQAVASAVARGEQSIAAPVGATSASPPLTDVSPEEQEPDPVADREQDRELEAPWRSITWRSRVIAAAAVLLVITGAGAFAARNYTRVPAMGTLIVNTSPSGVAASIDGEPRGTTPLTVDLAPGEHVLELAVEGQVRTIPVTIAAGGQIAQFIELPKAAPVTGHLHVRTEPSGAVITIDGERRGVSPLVIGGLAPGAYTVVLENALGSVTEEVTIEAGATAMLVVPLSGPKDAPVSGWISVAAPVEVQVFEDGRLLGSSRSERIMVSVGRHELDLANDALGYRVSRIVQVSPGRVTPIRIDVPKGSMALNATPWAEVWVDGERLGETPIGNVQLPIGTHQVVFRHPELGEQRHTVTVTVAAPARISADLRKQ